MISTLALLGLGAVGAQSLARMALSRLGGGARHVDPTLASAPLLSVLTPFAVAFTAPTYRHVLVLVSGTILASGRRTVAAALRAVGLGDERRLTTYHRVLNRDVWSALVLSRLAGPARAHPPGADAPLELVVDGTLERCQRAEGCLKGRFHDAARVPVGARRHE